MQTDDDAVYSDVHFDLQNFFADALMLRIQGGPKSEPLPNDQNIALNRIKDCR